MTWPDLPQRRRCQDRLLGWARPWRLTQRQVAKRHLRRYPIGTIGFGRVTGRIDEASLRRAVGKMQDTPLG
jgi:hypothetical protein